MIHRIKVPPTIPAQTNSWDCGVFLAVITKFLVLNQEFNFGTESMASIRNIMKKELETKIIETEFTDTRKGTGLMSVPINRDTQYKKKPEKGCTNSSTVENEEKGKMNQPGVKIINQTTEKGFSNTQCFTFVNFGVDTVFETNGTDTVCIGCHRQFKRIIAHLNNSKSCLGKVDFDNFSNAMIEIKKGHEEGKRKTPQVIKI